MAIFFYILFIVGIFLVALPLNIYSAKIGICDGLIEYFTKRTKGNGFDEIMRMRTKYLIIVYLMLQMIHQ